MIRSLLLLPFLFGLAACDETPVESTGTGGSGGSGGSGGASASTSETTSTTAGPAPEKHRPVAVACTEERPPGAIGGGPDGVCTADADCTEGVNGRCVQNIGQPTICSYDECAEDADCGAASVCECRNPAKHSANVCFHGNCLVDADCGEGGYCSPSAVTLHPSCSQDIPVGSFGYFCHTPEDECTDDADCTSVNFMPGCLFDTDTLRFACVEIVCLD